MRGLSWLGVLLGGLAVAVVAVRAQAGARDANGAQGAAGASDAPGAQGAAGAPDARRARGAAVRPSAVGREQAFGQWLWTARDRDVFTRARLAHPELVAAVLIGTIECAGGVLHTKRGLSPLSAGDGPRALVVRLSDSVQACVALEAPAEFSRILDERLSTLLSDVRASGARFAELQLDYDAPVSKLESWANALAYLNAHSLRGLELWITSLPAHIEQANYGALMQGLIAGHIIQVFDTGLRCDAENAQHLRAALQAQRIPYRVGYGTFERKGVSAQYSHACWLGLTRSWRTAPGASGWWLFPAGIGYGESLAQLTAAE
ncbi:MAG: DUF3142 domain-containing protein [Pseudomonadota bacterium]